MALVDGRRLTAALLALVQVTTQVAWADQAQATAWSERKAPREAIQLASLPANNALADLPAVRPALSSSLSAPQIDSKKWDHLSPAMKALVEKISFTSGSILSISDVKDPAGPPVLLIQDVHRNDEAQSNIADILSRLIQDHRIGRIAVEGAFSAFHFDAWKTVADPARVRAVAERFLKANRIAAHQFIGLIDPSNVPAMTGVDDPASYESNVEAYRAALDERAATTRALDQRRAALDARKAAVYSPAMTAFETARRANVDGKTGFGAYLEELARLMKPGDGPVMQFLDAYRLEKTINFPQVEKERKTVLTTLAQKLTTAEVADLVQRSLGYRAGNLSFGEYYGSLRDACQRHGVSLEQTPAFAAYVRYVILADGVNAHELLSAVSDLEHRAPETLAASTAERDLALQSIHLDLARKLVGFELTPEEWAAFQSAPGTLPNLNTFEDFYLQSDIRSRKMVDNLLRNPPSAASVLITGGFHTPEIAALLAHRRIPYAIVAPKISRLTDFSGTAYLSVFNREKTPLEKLFSGQKLFVNPAETAAVAADPVNLPGLRVLGEQLQRAASSTAALRAAAGMKAASWWSGLKSVLALGPSAYYAAGAGVLENAYGIPVVELIVQRGFESAGLANRVAPYSMAAWLSLGVITGLLLAGVSGPGGFVLALLAIPWALESARIFDEAHRDRLPSDDGSRRRLGVVLAFATVLPLFYFGFDPNALWGLVANYVIHSAYNMRGVLNGAPVASLLDFNTLAGLGKMDVVDVMSRKRFLGTFQRILTSSDYSQKLDDWLAAGARFRQIDSLGLDNEDVKPLRKLLRERLGRYARNGDVVYKDVVDQIAEFYGVKKPNMNLSRPNGANLDEANQYAVDVASKAPLRDAEQIRALSAPIYNALFHEQNLKDLMAYASIIRSCISYEYYSEKESPLAFAMRTKLYFPLGGNLYITPMTESFRRHILFEMDDQGNPVHQVEIKMPGDLRHKRLIDENSYTLAGLVDETYPGEAVAEKPIAMLQIKDYPELYGETPPASAGAPRVMIYRYDYDAKRLDHFDLAPFRAGGGAQIWDITTQGVVLLAKLHAMGLAVNDDGGSGNLRLHREADGKLKVLLAGDYEGYTREKPEFLERESRKEITNLARALGTPRDRDGELFDLYHRVLAEPTLTAESALKPAEVAPETPLTPPIAPTPGAVLSGLGLTDTIAAAGERAVGFTDGYLYHGTPDIEEILTTKYPSAIYLTRYPEKNAILPLTMSGLNFAVLVFTSDYVNRELQVGKARLQNAGTERNPAVFDPFYLDIDGFNDLPAIQEVWLPRAEYERYRELAAQDPATLDAKKARVAAFFRPLFATNRVFPLNATDEPGSSAFERMSTHGAAIQEEMKRRGFDKKLPEYAILPGKNPDLFGSGAIGKGSAMNERDSAAANVTPLTAEQRRAVAGAIEDIRNRIANPAQPLTAAEAAQAREVLARLEMFLARADAGQAPGLGTFQAVVHNAEDYLLAFANPATLGIFADAFSNRFLPALTEILFHEGFVSVHGEADYEAHRDIVNGIQRKLFGVANQVQPLLRSYINERVAPTQPVSPLNPAAREGVARSVAALLIAIQRGDAVVAIESVPEELVRMDDLFKAGTLTQPSLITDLRTWENDPALVQQVVAQLPRGFKVTEQQRALFIASLAALGLSGRSAAVTTALLPQRARAFVLRDGLEKVGPERLLAGILAVNPHNPIRLYVAADQVAAYQAFIQKIFGQSNTLRITIEAIPADRVVNGELDVSFTGDALPIVQGFKVAATREALVYLLFDELVPVASLNVKDLEKVTRLILTAA